MSSHSDTTKRFKVELAGVSFTSTSLLQVDELLPSIIITIIIISIIIITSLLQVDEQRVCWRGRVLPKNFDLSQDRNRKLVQSSRSSRLLRTRNIQDIKVRSEVHELGEFIQYIEYVQYIEYIEYVQCIQYIQCIGCCCGSYKCCLYPLHLYHHHHHHHHLYPPHHHHHLHPPIPHLFIGSGSGG